MFMRNCAKRSGLKSCAAKNASFIPKSLPSATPDISGWATAAMSLSRTSKMAREDFETFMRREVLEPAGMVASDFDPAEVSAALDGHGWWGERLPLYEFRARAASGLYSTAADLARFDGAAVQEAEGGGFTSRMTPSEASRAAL